MSVSKPFAVSATVPAPAKRGKGVYQDWSNDQVRRLLRLYVGGHRIAEIARRLDMPPQRVRDKLRYIQGNGYMPKTKRSKYGPRLPHEAVNARLIERACLCCGRTFFAEGRFQRLCQTHRVQSA